jgi:hypothetical protein
MQQTLGKQTCKIPGRKLDVHFISSLPVLQRPACMAGMDTRCVQIVGVERSTRPDHDVVDDAFD